MGALNWKMCEQLVRWGIACIIFSSLWKVSGLSPGGLQSASSPPLSPAVATIFASLPGGASYPIYIGKGILRRSGFLDAHVSGNQVLVVTNDVVGPLYSQRVRTQLEEHGKMRAIEVSVPDGEDYKTMDTLMSILDKAIRHKLDRKSTVVALGGGVVGDLAGFAAAVYQRGVRLVQVPTTLMAMVDSAVGGKNGVNHAMAKNLIGTILQPSAVLADIALLESLPQRQYLSGAAEIVKYGLMSDPDLLAWLERHAEDLVARHDDVVCDAIRRSCQAKVRVVAADEKEQGDRALLNLGHTFAHAIESTLGFGTWLHGEAVSVGLLMAAELSALEGLIPTEMVDRIRQLLLRLGLPVGLDRSIDEAFFLELMARDKKVVSGKLRLVLLHGSAGGAMVTDQFHMSNLLRVVKRYCNAQE